jgi:hypothetical protein
MMIITRWMLDFFYQSGNFSDTNVLCKTAQQLATFEINKLKNRNVALNEAKMQTN